MPNVKIEELKLLGVLGKEYPKAVVNLYLQAVQKTNLSILDFLTIRDIFHLARYQIKNGKWQKGKRPLDLSLHALVILCFDSLSMGDICLCLSKKNIEQRLDSLLNGENESTKEFHPKQIALEILKNIKTNENYKKIISNEKTSSLPIIHYKEKNQAFVFFQKYFSSLILIKKQLTILLKSHKENQDAEYIKKLKAASVQVLIDKNLLTNEGANNDLDLMQAKACILPFIKNFCVISGGPGTGKTSIILNIIRIWIRLFQSLDQIYIAAPTGRAAKRIIESLAEKIKGRHNSYSKLEDEDNTLEQQLKSKTIQGYTLHRLLKYQPRDNTFQINEKNPLPAKLIIIDEASMIDLTIMAGLTKGIHKKCTLVLIGDPDQLPAIEAGQIFTDIIPKDIAFANHPVMSEILSNLFPSIDMKDTKEPSNIFSENIVQLSKSFRTREPSILELMDQIKNFKPEKNKKQSDNSFNKLWKNFSLLTFEDFFIKKNSETFLSSPCSFHELTYKKGNDKNISYNLKAWEEFFLWFTNYLYNKEVMELLDFFRKTPIEHLFDENQRYEIQNKLQKIFSILTGVSILTIVRNGPYGAIFINKQISAILKEKCKVQSTNNYFTGSLISITENDYSKNLFNGDIGLILELAGGKYISFFPGVDEFTFFYPHSLPQHELAFSKTVHKAQGSEYDSIFLLLPDDSHNRLLSKEIIYTAITRAKKNIAIIGSTRIFRLAISRNLRKDTGFHFW